MGRHFVAVDAGDGPAQVANENNEVEACFIAGASLLLAYTRDDATAYSPRVESGQE